jgi:hypothetical protein
MSVCGRCELETNLRCASAVDIYGFETARSKEEEQGSSANPVNTRAEVGA